MSKPYSQKWQLVWNERKENDAGKLTVALFYNGYYGIGVLIVRVRAWETKHPTSGGGTLGQAKRVIYKILEGKKRQCIRETITRFDRLDIDACVNEPMGGA